jgi:hypothetical protein
MTEENVTLSSHRTGSEDGVDSPVRVNDDPYDYGDDPLPILLMRCRPCHPGPVGAENADAVWETT